MNLQDFIKKNQEDIDKSIEFVNSLIEESDLGDRKEKIIYLLEQEGNRFFTAPASAKLEQHSTYPGGLAYHSIMVTKNFLKLRKAFSVTEIPESSFILSGIFHDLGKIGTVIDNIKDYYIYSDNEWRRNNLGEYYTYNKELNDGLTVSQRSLRNLSKYNISLTDDEYVAILGHDGLYIEQNNTMEMKYSKSKLLRLLHMADSYTCFVEGI
jgi:hypothetical protein